MYAIAILKFGRLLVLSDKESYERVRNILLTKKTDCNAVFKLKSNDSKSKP